MIPTLVTGDDLDLLIPLQTPTGAAADVSGATSVKVALVALDRSSLLAGPYAASDGYGGASWVVGQVVVPVPGADSALLSAPQVDVEVEVIKAGRRTTYLGTAHVRVIKGLIP